MRAGPEGPTQGRHAEAPGAWGAACPPFRTGVLGQGADWPVPQGNLQARVLQGADPWLPSAKLSADQPPTEPGGKHGETEQDHSCEGRKGPTHDARLPCEGLRQAEHGLAQVCRSLHVACRLPQASPPPGTPHTHSPLAPPASSAPCHQTPLASQVGAPGQYLRLTASHWEWEAQTRSAVAGVTISGDVHLSINYTH